MVSPAVICLSAMACWNHTPFYSGGIFTTCYDMQPVAWLALGIVALVKVSVGKHYA